MDGGLAAADVDEFLMGLDEWRAAPTANRLRAEGVAIRALAHNGYLEAIDEPLERFTTLVQGLDSDRARRWLAEIHGTVARARRDWVEAAYWYDKVVKAGDGTLRNWFDLATAWHLLTARCLCPGEVSITGAEFREPWECFRNGNLENLCWHGAVSSAVALQRLGRAALALRFVSWVNRHDLGDMVPRNFHPMLETAGLPTAHVEGNDDLDALIEELFVVADEIDSGPHRLVDVDRHVKLARRRTARASSRPSARPAVDRRCGP